jgi:hypothetical protein
MMVLVGFSMTKTLLGVLSVSLGLLVLIIAYRKLLAYLGKGSIIKEDYCILYPLESDPISGEAEFYFTTEKQRNIIFELLNADMTSNQVLTDKEYALGGHIVRFDTNLLANGLYFYCLRTENQKTMKKMNVRNKNVVD